MIDFIAVGISVAGFIFLFLQLDRLIYKENAERKKALHDMSTKINTLGGDISLLAIKKKQIIHVVVHDAEAVRQKKKAKERGRGIASIVPLSREDH